MKMRFAKAVGGTSVLAAMTLSILLSGCGWFDGPPKLEKLRPGAERALQPSDSLPALPPPGGYDAAIMPIDETQGGPAIGSIIAASGGQKAQIEKLEKEASARDAEDRAAREKADAEKAKMDPATPGKQAGTGDRPGEPPTQPMAPASAPVGSGPVLPPPAPADALPTNDNNTPTKPAGT